MLAKSSEIRDLRKGLRPTNPKKADPKADPKAVPKAHPKAKAAGAVPRPAETLAQIVDRVEVGLNGLLRGVGAPPQFGRPTEGSAQQTQEQRPQGDLDARLRHIITVLRGLQITHSTAISLSTKDRVKVPIGAQPVATSAAATPTSASAAGSAASSPRPAPLPFELQGLYDPAAKGCPVPFILPRKLTWDSQSKTLKDSETPSDGSFYVVDDALAMLRSITRPVCVICVAGPARSGKSYILNEILGLSENAFHIGHTAAAATLGIWIWSHPLEREINGQKVAIVLMDTEGIGHATAESHHDNQILLLSVLLSSVFVFNHLGSPELNHLDQLLFTSQLARSVKLRADAVSKKDVRDAMPEFVWLCRDLTLNVVTADEKAGTVT